MKLYNSLTRKIEQFRPLNPPRVGMYTCGMTVYDYAHIGHGRRYVNDDILRRTLEYMDYKVKHVQNVTDVGHLVSDADEGDDKMEKGARKAGKTVWEVAKFFTKHFYNSMDKLNVLRPNIVAKATDLIQVQIDLIKQLLKKGYAYETPEAVYFDISKFKDYWRLSSQKLEEKIVGVREEVETGKHKKNPADFALWFKRVGRFRDHVMHWDSPWGEGFPGWHIECSAISMKYLGETIDIHTGGVDHISVHHPNEIAQSEAVTGQQFVRYWIHHEFLLVDGEKMSKSLGNIYRVEDIEKRGFDPLDLRYFYLTAHYRKQQNFTWEGLKGAKNAREKLLNTVAELRHERGKINKKNKHMRPKKIKTVVEYRKKFEEVIGNDLNMPEALAVVWEVVKSDLEPKDKYSLIMDFDKVLGLKFAETRNLQLETGKIPDGIRQLLVQREGLRREHRWGDADKIRKKIEKEGYIIRDTPAGAKLIKT